MGGINGGHYSLSKTLDNANGASLSKTLDNNILLSILLVIWSWMFLIWQGEIWAGFRVGAIQTVFITSTTEALVGHRFWISRKNGIVSLNCSRKSSRSIVWMSITIALWETIFIRIVFFRQRLEFQLQPFFSFQSPCRIWSALAGTLQKHFGLKRNIPLPIRTLHRTKSRPGWIGRTRFRLAMVIRPHLLFRRIWWHCRSRKTSLSSGGVCECRWTATLVSGLFSGIARGRLENVPFRFYCYRRSFVSGKAGKRDGAFTDTARSPMQEQGRPIIIIITKLLAGICKDWHHFLLAPFPAGTISWHHFL